MSEKSLKILEEELRDAVKTSQEEIGDCSD